MGWSFMESTRGQSPGPPAECRCRVSAGERKKTAPPGQIPSEGKGIYRPRGCQPMRQGKGTGIISEKPTNSKGIVYSRTPGTDKIRPSPPWGEVAALRSPPLFISQLPAVYFSVESCLFSQLIDEDVAPGAAFQGARIGVDDDQIIIAVVVRIAIHEIGDT